MRDGASTDRFKILFKPWEHILTTDKSFTAMRSTSREDFVNLLLLDFFAANLLLQPQAVLSSLVKPFPEAKIVLNLSTMASLDNAEANIDAHERTLDALQIVVDAIDFISGCLLARTQRNAAPPTSTFDVGQLPMLQRFCHQRLNAVERSMARLNRALDARDKVHNIQESISVKRLTILATIFLPLSLSASILSMQTRFANLRLLLYDFIGVFTIVGTAAILMLLLVRTVLKFKSTRVLKMFSPSIQWDIPGKWETWRSERPFKLRSVCFTVIYVLLWAVVLASFIVGMLKNVILGLKILGFGFAGALGTLLVCSVLFACCYLPFSLMTLMAVSEEKQRRRLGQAV